MKYYDASKIDNENAPWNVIFGGRSNGKSTAVCKMLIDKCINNGEQFGRTVRYITDCRDELMQGWFGDYLQNYCKERYKKQIIFTGSQWFFVDSDTSDPFSLKNKRIPFGRVFIINSEYRYKSSQFDEITNLINEEFVLMNSADYIPYEFEHFLSLVSTVNRHRTNLRIWLIGNTLNKANPYFSGLGINIDKLKIYPSCLRVMHNELGVKYAIEYAEMSYETKDEIPEILRITGNEIAFCGDFAQDPNVYSESEMFNFMNSTNYSFICSLFHKGNHYRLYRVSITNKINGFAVIKNWSKYGGKDTVYINLNNRLVDIHKQKGATIAYLKEVGFDRRLCLYDDEEIKFALETAIKNY